MEVNVILSKINPGAFTNSKEFKRAAEEVAKTIKRDCPNIVWKDSYALLGDYDVIDVVEAQNKAEIMKAVEIIRAIGKAHTQTFSAIPWREHIDSL